MPAQELQAIVSVISSGGALTLAVFIIVLFWKGDIVSARTVEHILSEVSARTIATVERLLDEYREESADKMATHLTGEHDALWKVIGEKRPRKL
jgi:hypothetical protein